MTALNRVTLKTFFQQNDVPQGTDYANLIDSCLNVAETGTQSILGPFNPTELVTPRVSAASGNYTTTLSAKSMAVSAMTVTTQISAQVYYGSASRCDFNFHGTPLIVSAAGTAQATAAQLTAEFCRLQGATDSQTTGFTLLANRQGWVQYLANECTVSANLWPPTGGKINALANNAAFALAANTPYYVYHSQASAYQVK